MAGSFTVVDVKTAPIDGQKTGTSGLRKKVAEFKKPNYLANWVQSLFSSIDGLKGTAEWGAAVWVLAWGWSGSRRVVFSVLAAVAVSATCCRAGSDHLTI